ncbi:FISUMP domain-containing protein [Rhodohalobacter barkolensis]|uniref:Fibronectin type-III domain-containing protein n=1 Tax=Rhodohalobacter barkolensis TaxID=2053187 RepID=A0A2N0VHN3_9BACT|nr:FISUMP domain-containing protein [Rhodohalobacter barkolensis]PKD43706.1 hypothetical protein CWD77_09100 [Rhodohalobacter barkolensis]
MTRKIYLPQALFFFGFVTMIIITSCSDKSPTSVTEDPEKGSIEGQTITSDTQEGINDAFVILSAQNITDRETYTEDGKFQFSNLDHGEYQLKIRLPQGYSENDNLEKIITVDGPVNIEVRADPVREQTVTIQRGTKDTLATSSGVYLTVDATESEADVEMHIEETVESLFSGQQILSKPIQIRLGSSNGGSTSSLLQAEMISSATSGNKITMSILQSYSGNTDEAMFAFQFDEEEPVFAYAEGIPKEYLDSRVNQGTEVMAHEFTLSPDAEFQFKAALTKIDRTCDDSEISQGYRSLKELDGVLDGEKPLILIHGIQLQNATCDDFLDYDPEVDLFEPLLKELQEDHDIHSNYKVYIYRYTSNAPVLENSVALWDMMQSEGIEEPVIIAHSMGGLVARGLMLSEGEDKVDGLITLGTPHEGSPLADLISSTHNIKEFCDQNPIIASRPFCQVGKLGSLVPNTPGFLDLSPNSDVISDFQNLKGSNEKIYSLGGKLNPEMDWDLIMGPRIKAPQTDLVYQAGWSFLGGVSSYNDGIVPLESALPEWSGLQSILNDHNHSEVARGIHDNASSVFDVVRPVLLQLASIITVPQLVTSDVTDITSTSATTGGQISNDGGADITARGVCWSTNQDPSLNDSCTNDGSGVGEFESTITDLTAETEYFVRAYATNDQGTGYGEQRNFTTESESGNGDWPRDTTTEVVDVYNPATGRTWMDRNLGASRAATSRTDSEAYGDLYQWGRAADGHEKRNSSTTSTLSNTDQPGHSNYILAPNSPRDWRSPQNDNLWQGVNSINNPCPDGYRLPTEAEWEAERQSWNSNDIVGAFESPLKLPAAGFRDNSSGFLDGVGGYGFYWSSTVSETFSLYLFSDSISAYILREFRSSGLSLRCIKD